MISNRPLLVSQAIVGPIDRSADSPNISWGGDAENNNSGTGLRGDIENIHLSILGVDVMSWDEDGIHIDSGSILGPSSAYAGSGSFQPIGPDLELAAGAGSWEINYPSFLAPIMGNLLGDDLTQDANYLAGIIAAYSVTGTKATTYPAGACLGLIMDEVTEADGAFVAVIDGDSGLTTANAAFKAMSNNSTVGSGFDYGLDLHAPAHDGYNTLAILKADIRMMNEVCVFTNAGVPSDGAMGTGAGFAGPGSMVVDITNKDIYINANTKASPTWKLVTRAA